MTISPKRRVGQFKPNLIVVLLCLFLPAAGLTAPRLHETPEAFVKRIFAAYSRTSDACRAFCEAEFASMVHAANDGGSDVLGYDPICQCNGDIEGPYVIIDTKGAGTVYDVKVRRDEETWTLVLHRVGEGWKIFDVRDRQGSLRALLKRSLKRP